jgi:hypothetical protein
VTTAAAPLTTTAAHVSAATTAASHVPAATATTAHVSATTAAMSAATATLRERRGRGTKQRDGTAKSYQHS